MSEDSLELGGNIALSGFKDLDGAEMIVVKKVVGSYARKLSDIGGMDELHVTLKTVHSREKSEKYEIHARATMNGKTHASEGTDRNLFMVMDSVLKKVLATVNKK